ncbi:MAG TPA: helix-turn-helix domain-containing protein, partial [Gemmataceae bacterium]|nr:helix-turn-helix domain-containing protein [Gemmataceae bacterium]
RLVEALRHLPWEGNSRQLENTIRQMVAHKERGHCLVPSDLPAWALEALTAPAVPTEDAEDASDETATPEGITLPFTEAIEAYERRLLAAALTRYEGNRTQAAAALGLSPRTIFNKIRKYKLA